MAAEINHKVIAAFKMAGDWLCGHTCLAIATVSIEAKNSKAFPLGPAVLFFVHLDTMTGFL